MAMEHTDHHQQHSSFLLDSLYCEEERWGEGELEDEEVDETSFVSNQTSFLMSPLLLEQDLFWEDEELVSLFSKEKETHLSSKNIDTDPSLSLARKEAVEWILKVNAYYGFSALTAILAINYLDRFLSSLHYQKDKPWMIHLAAVTCISLAAKVEETQVPVLLDFQLVESRGCLFESKTIQKMELLVMSTLKWRLNPVTPLSFLDHIIRRLGLKNHVHWEFLRGCENLLLSLVADSRFARFLPSVLATATMLHVISQVEPRNAIDYQDQLLDVLKISKDGVNDCSALILELSNGGRDYNGRKRKHDEDDQVPSSPSGVIDAPFCSDNSNDSWFGEPSVTSSPAEPLRKKKRVQEQQMRLPSLSRVFVDAIGSPR